MIKTELKDIMHEHRIIDCEVEDAIIFVYELLNFQADKLEKTEPYAVNTIKKLREASYEVWNLLEYVEYAMEEE
jgi:hypothetical protein